MLSAFLLVACGGAAPSEPTTPPPREPVADEARGPQSFDEGLARLGLTRLELEPHPTESMGSMGSEPIVADGVVTVTETFGWRSSVTLFATREDGTVVVALPAPEVIVDRHVDGGCQTFAGGRMYTREVTYTLPEGARYGGVVRVPYEEHTEVIDYTPTQADGSPCPPMALD